jgi:hypothetical protein
MISHNKLDFFYGEVLLAPCPSPRLEDNPHLLSMAACSVYSQISSIAGGCPAIRKLKTRRAVVSRGPT